MDKDGGLWSLRPEFESPPGYQPFSVCVGRGRGGVVVVAAGVCWAGLFLFVSGGWEFLFLKCSGLGGLG